MAINLLEKVQENLNYQPLQKIDPNQHNDSEIMLPSGEKRFSQAAIPAVLISLYKYSTGDAGATEILQGNDATNWISKIFDDSRKEVVETIATYVDKPKEKSYRQMNDIANEGVKLVRENIPENGTIKDVKTFLSNQVNNILPFLPPALHMGDILNDTSLDDNTNKMKGPISSMMHKIGSAFSTPETDEDIHLKL